jgi:transposase
LDNYPISSNSLEKFFYINGNQLGQQYKEYLSSYQTWDQKEHAQEWILFPDNIGPYLSIDETALSNGELYTVLTNKEGKGQKGTLVAMIEGTEADRIIAILNQIPENARAVVKEVTLDMAGSMNKIVKRCFPVASLVIDRFHVQKLAYDALQEMRIAHRWDAINEETNLIDNARLNNERYIAPTLSNGDTKKQLLARSRYLLFKSGGKWTPKQKERASLLFEMYPDIKKAYSLTHSLRMIFSDQMI